MTSSGTSAERALLRWFGLEGRTALVVGASSGLGARAAHVLASAGASIGLFARREAQLEEQASRIRAASREVSVFVGDVTEEGAIERGVAQVEAELGPISILVYACGISPLGRAERHTRAKWDQAIAVNLTGAFEASQSVARRLIDRGEAGSIIHIASVVGMGAGAVHRASGYAASKGGLVNLTRQLAVEWAGQRIRVNAIVPGYFATELTIDPRHGDIAPEQKRQIETLTPLGRVGEIEEIDTAIAFLAAPASSYVTGAMIPVDGGWTAW